MNWDRFDVVKAKKGEFTVFLGSDIVGNVWEVNDYDDGKTTWSAAVEVGHEFGWETHDNLPSKSSALEIVFDRAGTKR